MIPTNVQGRTMLCHRFDRWVKKFDLITPDLLIVPLDDNSDNLSDNSDGDGYVFPKFYVTLPCKGK